MDKHAASGQDTNPRLQADLKLREEHQRFAALAPSLWHSEAIGHLRAKWDEFNAAFFDGRLAPPYLSLDAPASSRRMGAFAPVSGFGGYAEITIRRSILDGSWEHVRGGDEYREGRLRVVEDILLHEMIHHYHQEISGQTEDSYHGHGPAFRDECVRIGGKLGLPPVRSAHKRGKDKDLPSCAQWPHCVRPRDHYLGAYIWPEDRAKPVSRAVATRVANEPSEELARARKELEGASLAIGFVRALLDGSEGDVITFEGGAVGRDSLEDRYNDLCGDLEDAAVAFFGASVRTTSPEHVTNDGDTAENPGELSAAAD